MRAEHMPLTAYCPLAQAGDLRRGLLSDPGVVEVARAHDATPMQVLLAFVLRDQLVVAIPRSGDADHVLENVRARDIELTADDLSLLSRSFPAPGHPVPLDIVCRGAGAIWRRRAMSHIWMNYGDIAAWGVATRFTNVSDSVAHRKCTEGAPGC